MDYHQWIMRQMEEILSNNIQNKLKAEKMIMDNGKTNTYEAMSTLSKIIQNDGFEIRYKYISAGLIQKLFKKEDFYSLWNNLRPESKTEIENNLFFSLNSIYADTVKAAKTALTSMGTSNIIFKGNDNITGTLSKIVEENSGPLQEAALTNIKDILEELPLNCKSMELFGFIFTALTEGLKKDGLTDNYVISTISCLDSLLHFYPSIVKEENKKNWTFDCINNYLSHTSEEVRNAVYWLCHTLISEDDMIYVPFAPNLKKIMENLGKGESKQNVLVILDLWKIIVNKENELIQKEEKEQLKQEEKRIKVGEDALPIILPELLKILSSVNIEEDTEPIEFAIDLINAYSMYPNAVIVGNILGYINNNYNSQDLGIVKSAILSLASIQGTKEKMKIFQVTKKSLSIFLSYHFGNNFPSFIRDSTSVLIKHFTEYFSVEIISDLDTFNKVINYICFGLKEGTLNSKCVLCDALFNLTSKIKQQEEINKKIQPFFKQCLDSLTAITINPKNFSEGTYLAETAFKAINSLIAKYSPSSENDLNEVKIFYNHLLGFLKDIPTIIEFKTQELKEYYCSEVIGTIIIILNKQCFKPEDYNLLINVFISTLNKLKGIYINGLMFISTLSLKLEEDFEEYYDSLITFVEEGLKSVEDTSIYKESLRSIYILYDSSYELIKDKSEYIIESIINNCKSLDTLDNSFLSNSILTLGMIFSKVPKEVFLYYINAGMDLIKNTMKKTLTESLSNEEEEIEELKYLTDSILITLNNILFGLSFDLNVSDYLYDADKINKNKKESIIPYVDDIIMYLKNIFGNINYANRITVLKESLCLLIKLRILYGEYVIEKFTVEGLTFVYNTIQGIINSFEDQEEIKEILNLGRNTFPNLLN